MAPLAATLSYSVAANVEGHAVIEVPGQPELSPDAVSAAILQACFPSSFGVPPEATLSKVCSKVALRMC